MFPPRNVVLKSVPCEKLNLRRAVGETCRNLGTEIQPIPWEDWGLCRQARASYDLVGKSHAWEEKTIVEWKNTWVCIKRWLLEESYLLTWGLGPSNEAIAWDDSSEVYECKISIPVLHRCVHLAYFYSVRASCSQLVLYKCITMKWTRLKGLLNRSNRKIIYVERSFMMTAIYT